MIPITYVPGRNTVFIAIALSLAEAKDVAAIYLGINAVDYSGYPDCRPDYLEAYQLATLSSKAGLEGKAPQLVAPLVMVAKQPLCAVLSNWECRSPKPGRAIREKQHRVGYVIRVAFAIVP